MPPQGERGDERAVALNAARSLGLNSAGAQLISHSSRAIWYLPASGAALTISRPRSKTEEDLAAEITAGRAARAAGVATPMLLAGPIALHGARYAAAFEWISGRPAGAADWPAIVREAARLSAAATADIPTLDWPGPIIDRTDTEVLGAELAAVLTRRAKIASEWAATLTSAGDLVLAHGDLQPANAVIDVAGRAWLLDLEYARAAPREWDPGKLVVLNRRFGDPVDLEPLLQTWRYLDDDRLAMCAATQEVLLVLWLVRMAHEGTSGAAAEARKRAASLAGDNVRWRHLT